MLFVNTLISQCQRPLLCSDNYACSWQMPAKSGRSRPAVRTNDDEDGTHDEAVSDSEIREAEADIREAGPREAPSSTPRFSPRWCRQLCT